MYINYIISTEACVSDSLPFACVQFVKMKNWQPIFLIYTQNKVSFAPTE